MKKLLLSFAMLLTLAGCSSDGGTTEGGGGGNEQPGTPTESKTYSATIESAKQFGFEWSANSTISLFTTTRNEQFGYDVDTEEFQKIDTSKPASIATPNLFGIYPYTKNNKASKDGALTLSIPVEQTYKADGVDFTTTPMIAVADLDATEMEFKHICGYLNIPIYSVLVDGAQPLTIKSIRLSSITNESISGSVKIETEKVSDDEYVLDFGTSSSTHTILDCGQGVTIGSSISEATPFHFAVPAGTYTDGFVIEITNDQDRIIKKAIRAEVVIARGEVTDVEAVDFVVDEMGELLLDIDFNLDGSAQDIGKFRLDVERIVNADSNTPYLSTYTHPQFTLNNIAHFGGHPHDKRHDHSFYRIDIASPEMQSAMSDGFTMETIAMTPTMIAAHWSRLISTEYWGLLREGAVFANNWNPTSAYFNNPGTGWNQFGIKWYTNSHLLPKTYYHIMYVYDSLDATVSIYINGALDSQQTIVGEMKIGNTLAIGAYPYANGSDYYQPWVGDIAMVRIYDNALDDDSVAKRYNSIEMPTHVNNNPRPTPLLDLQAQADGTFINNGSINANLTLITNDEGQAPDIKLVKLDTYDKPIIGFKHVDSVEETTPDSYFKLTSAECPDFFAKLNDGAYTVEAIIGAPGAGRGHTVPISTEALNLIYVNNSQRFKFATFDENRGFYAAESFAQASMGTYHHIFYVMDVGTNKSAFNHINGWNDCAYNGGYIPSFAPMSTFTVGCAVAREDNGVPFARSFDGNIVWIRVYDEALSLDEMDRIYNEDNIQATLDALNSGNNVSTVKPEPFIDVQFSNDNGTPKAVDVLSGVPVTYEDSGEGTLTVENGVATFARGAGKKGSFFKVDWSELDEIKQAINDGYTVEIIHSAIRVNGEWKFLFGGDGFSLRDFGGGKWTMWWVGNDGNYFHSGGDPAMNKADNVYYHTLFSRNRRSNAYTIYTNNTVDGTYIIDQHFDATYTFIGAGVSERNDGSFGYWNGNIAMFRIYNEPVDKDEAKLLYFDIEDKLKALNAK